MGYGFETSYFIPIMAYLLPLYGSNIVYISSMNGDHIGSLKTISGFLQTIGVNAKEIELKDYSVVDNQDYLYVQLSVLLNVNSGMNIFFMSGTKAQLKGMLKVLNDLTKALYNGNFEEAGKHYMAIGFESENLVSIGEENSDYIKNVYVIDFYSLKEQHQSDRTKIIKNGVTDYTGMNPLGDSKLYALYCLTENMISLFPSHQEGKPFTDLIRMMSGTTVDWIYGKGNVQTSGILTSTLFLTSVEMESSNKNEIIALNPTSISYSGALDASTIMQCDFTLDDPKGLLYSYLIGVIVNVADQLDIVMYTSIVTTLRYVYDMDLPNNYVIRPYIIYGYEGTISSKVNETLYNEDKEIIFYIGGWNNNVRYSINNIIGEYIKNTGEQRYFLYPGEVVGDECLEHTFYLNLPFIAMSRVFTPFLARSVSDSFYILTDQNENRMKEVNVLQSEFKEKSITLDGITVIPPDESQLNTVFESILMKIRGGIIILISYPLNIKAVQSLKELQLNITSHPVFMYEFDIAQFNTLDADTSYDLVTSFEGIYLHSTYPMEVTNSYTQRFKSFYQYYNNYYSSDGHYLTTDYIHFFAGLEFIREVVKAAGGVDNSEDFHKYIYNIKHELSIGNVFLQKNNYFSGSMSLLMVKGYDLKLLSAMYSPLEASPYSKAFNGEIVTCDWVNENPEMRGAKIIYPIEKTLPIGLILSFGKENIILNRAVFDMFICLVDYLNEQGGFQGLFANYLLYDYQDDLELAQKYASGLIRSGVTLVVGCVDDKCRRAIAPLFNGVNSVLVYLGSNEGQECIKHVLHPGRTYSQYSNILERVIDIIPFKVIYVVGTDKQSTDYFYEIAKNIYGKSSSSYIVKEKVLTLPQVELTSLLYEIIFSPYKSVVFDLTLGNEFILFSSIINKMNISPEQAIFISLYCPGIKYENSVESFEGRYCISSYFSDGTMGDTNYLLWKYVARADIIEIMDNLYLAFNAFIGLLQSVDNIYDVDGIIEAGYYSFVESANGKVQLLPNGYWSRNMYLLKLENEKWIQVIAQSKPVEPLAFDWNIEGSYQKICDFYNDIGIDGIVPLYTIGIAVALTGPYAVSDDGINDLMRITIDQFNMNGLLHNKRLYYIVIDIGSDDSTCYQNIKSELENMNILFTTGTMTCQYMLEEDLKDLNILLFSLDQSYSDKCSTNMILFGRHASLSNDIVDRLLFLHRDFALIGVSRDYGEMYSNFFSTYIPMYGGNVLFSVLVPPTTTDYDKIFSNLFARMSEGIILFFGLPEHLLVIINTLKEAGKDEIFDVISFTVSEEISELKDANFYAVSTYWYSSPSASVKEMNAELEELLGYSRVLSEKMVLSYYALQYWYLAAKDVESLDSLALRDKMYTFAYTKPEYGSFQLKTNNMISAPIVYINFNYGKASLLYYSLYSKLPNQYDYRKTYEPFTCDIPSNQMKIKTADARIALISSITGSWQLIEESYFTTFIYIIDQLNEEEGGIFDTFIIPEIIDTESKIEGYERAMERVVLRDDIQATFFFGTREVASVILDKAEIYNKLVFYSGLTETESCPEYTITVGPVNSQLIQVFELITPKAVAIVLIHDNISTNIDFINITKAYTENFKTNFSSYDISKLDNVAELLERDYGSVHPYVLLALSRDNLVQFFKQIPKDKFPRNKYSFTLIGVNEYFIEKYKDETSSFFVINSMFDTLLSNRDYTDPTTVYNNLYQKHLNGRNKYYITSESQSAYVSIMLWRKGVLNAYSFDPSSVRHALYGSQLDTPGSEVVVLTNNYITHRAFASMIINGNIIPILGPKDPYQPVVYNPSNNNNIYYTCDWTIDSSTSSLSSDSSSSSSSSFAKIENPTKIIGFIFSITSETRKQAMQSLFYASILIDRLNLKGGLLGYYMIPRIFGYRDSSTMKEHMKEFLDDDRVVVVFGCLDIECRSEYLSKGRGNKMLYYFGPNVDNFCNRYVLNMMPSVLQKIPAITRYLINLKVTNFYSVTSGNEEYPFYYYYYIFIYFL